MGEIILVCSNVHTGIPREAIVIGSIRERNRTMKQSQRERCGDVT